jgi:adenine-specific DNA-methyltransferase
MCDEIFGEENFIGCAGRITKKSNNKGEFWAPNFDYVVTYTKNTESAIEFFGGANVEAYNLVDEQGPRKGEQYQLVRLYMSTIENRNPEQRFWIECPDGSKVIPPGITFPPDRPVLGDGIWRWTKTKFEAERDKIIIKEVRSSNLLNEVPIPVTLTTYSG